MRDTITPVPALRSDLDAFPVEIDGSDMIVLRDPSGYADRMIQFHPEAWPVLMLFDGRRSIENVCAELSERFNATIEPSVIAEMVDALDEHHFLANERFEAKRDARDAEWMQRAVRPAAHAGNSYPADPEELRAFLAQLFDADATFVPDAAPAGVIAPHIDLQVGPDVYVPAFRALAKADIDTIVLLGTSHYSSEDLFILTEKHYETPLGVLPTDIDLVRRVRELANDIFTCRDVAHKPEHSLEFPALFLQHVFGNERVRVLPVLCTSFEEHLLDGTAPSDDPRYRVFIKSLQTALLELGRKAAYVMSVDWSHIGRKFGDDADAADILPTVRTTDMQQLEALARCDYERFASLLRASKNASRIDGYACITAFFDLVHPSSAALLCYDQWHEEERASGVTYASMAFYA